MFYCFQLESGLASYFVSSFAGWLVRGLIAFSLCAIANFSWALPNAVAQEEDQPPAEVAPEALGDAPFVSKFQELPPIIEHPRGNFKNPLVIELHGEITYGLLSYFKIAMQKAENANVDLLIVEIDSPGGLLDVSLEIAFALRDCDFARTIAKVDREAISGGAIIALGCDEIWMDPNAQIGDAGPVAFGLDNQFRHAPEKIRSYLISNVRQLAIAKNRPPAIPEAMVHLDAEVFRVTQHADQRQWFLNESEWKSIADPKPFDKHEPVLESRPGSFLTISGKRGVELLLTQGTFANVEEFNREFQLPKELWRIRRTWVDRVVYILNLPVVSFLLLLLGLVSIYLETTSPGIGVGALGALGCFGLFFWSHILGGTAGWLEIFLFILGCACLLMEIFVIPGFGISGISGIFLLFISLLMAMQTSDIPRSVIQWRQLQVNLIVVLSSFAGFGVSIFLMVRYMNRLPVLNRLALQPPTAEVPYSVLLSPGSQTTALQKNSESGKNPEGPSAFPAVGDWGIAESPLRPSGKARFEETIADVLTEGDFIETGTQVRVIRRQGNQIIVRGVAAGN